MRVPCGSAVRAWMAMTALAVIPGAVGGEPIDRMRDRGPGISTSMFGTYVRPGELLVYPFFEHYRDHDFEYKPSELGYGLDRDFRGRYEANEGLVFLGYGLTERLAIEFEVAAISARLERAAGDASGMPVTLAESGLGDVQSLVTWRWLTESGGRPEIFSLVEVVFPLQRERALIGTREWEIKTGVGAIRGFRWGTLGARAALEHEAGTTEVGEVAVEYLKRVSRTWRFYTGVEGTQDEVELIAEAQWHFAERVFLKLNQAFGLTSKAIDWAPELGVMFSVAKR